MNRITLVSCIFILTKIEPRVTDKLLVTDTVLISLNNFQKQTATSCAQNKTKKSSSLGYSKPFLLRAVLKSRKELNLPNRNLVQYKYKKILFPFITSTFTVLRLSPVSDKTKQFYGTRELRQRAERLNISTKLN